MLRLTHKRALFTGTAILAMLYSVWSAEAQSASSSGPSATVRPGATAGTGASTKHRTAKQTKKTTPEPEVVQPPPPPPTPEQMPPVAPVVSYQSGQLTIQSKNATLAQVLRSVQSKTGATFEIPSSANNERVVAQLGPGTPSDVLATLLRGSKFDYIILGVPNQPGTVQKLILTTRQNAPTTNTAQNRAPQPTQPEEPSPEDDYAQPEPAPDNSAAENENTQPQGPGGFRPGAYVPGQTGPNGEFPPQQPGQNNPDQQAPQGQQGAKTPDQLLQELQRMQQQQQMYQQQLNPANQNPPMNQPQPEQQ